MLSGNYRCAFSASGASHTGKDVSAVTSVLVLLMDGCAPDDDVCVANAASMIRYLDIICILPTAVHERLPSS